MHDDDRDAYNVRRVALTCFPSLTGLRPSATRNEFRTETYESRCALSDLQGAIQRDSALPGAAVFQAAWVRIVSAYTGTEDDITFLSILPRSCDVDRICCPSLAFSRYNAQEHERALSGQNLCQISEQISNATFNDSDEIPNKNGGGEGYQLDGTLLDLADAFCASDGCDVSDNRRHSPSRYAAAIRIQVFSSRTGLLSFRATFSDSCLDSHAAKLMLVQFDHMLWSFISNLKTLIEDVHVISPLLSTSNHEAASLGRFSSLHSQFEHFANAEKDRVALEFKVNAEPSGSDATYTYGTLNRKAETVAANLQKRFGSLIDHVIPICMDRCPEIYIAILGILKAGGAWCPIDPSFPPRLRHDLISRTGAKVLVLNADSPQDGIPEEVIAINITDMEWNSPSKAETPSIFPNSLAYLIWTSGTTGSPKGVPISHEAAVASMRALQACIPKDVKYGHVRCLQFSQFTFDVFVQDLFYTWGVGGTLISADRATLLASFAEFATKTRATHAHLTPAFAASVARKDCPTLKVVTMVGEKLTQNVADDWSEDCLLYNTYGPAETTVVSTFRHVPHGDKWQSANVGFPLPTVSAFVMRDGRLVMKNGIGELALGGPQLSRGYWKDPKKTAERFVWNERLRTTLYMTGDLVRQLHDGSFEFVGRTDDLVKIQGIRIELSEISFALRSCHAKVQQVEVFFLERPDRPSKVLVAFLAAPEINTSCARIITDEGGAEVARRAIETAKTELPNYMIPKVFVVVGAIPRTSSAKIDRNAIKQMYEDIDLGCWEKQLSSNQDDESGPDDFDTDEIQVLDIIADLTGTSRTAMGRQSMLASIGLDSITATRLATRLCAQGLNASVAVILQCQTLGDLLQGPGEDRSQTNETSIDLSVFHNEYLDYLSHGLARRVELVMPVFPVQESLLSESLQNASSYWSHKLFDLGNGIDLQRLEDAWRHVAQRTDALRTAFYPVAELSKEPHFNAAFLQLIFKETLLDWTTASSSNDGFRNQVRDHAQEAAERYQKNRFAEPPWAVTIFTQGLRNVMMISIHHSIRDEPSLDFVISDLRYAYLCNAAQQPQQRHQLRDAISLLHTDRDQAEQDEEFWMDCLSRFVDAEESKSWPELKLSGQDHSEGTIAHTWCAGFSYKKLQARAIDIGAASVASFLRVTWGCILVEYLEADRVVFGETWSARSEAPSLADVIGPLISVIPVPFQSRGNLREALQDMNNSQKRSKAHNGVHPRSIRRILGKPENTALYPAIFNFIPDSAEQGLSGTRSIWEDMEDIVELSVEHAIALNASISKDDILRFELIAARQYMDLAHLNILAQQIDALIDLILDRPDEPLASLVKHMSRDRLSTAPTEADTICNSAYAQTPTGWVDYHASLHPQWPAAEVVDSLDDEDVVSEKWSYEQMRTAYRNVATLINRLGCERHIIAVCLDRRLDVYAVILGIMSTGNTYLPIAEELPEERKLFLLKDSEAALLFTTRSLASDFSRSNQTCRTIFVEVIDYSKPCHVMTDISPQPSDNAYLLYTSGSTGIPKGVLVSRGNLMSFIEAISYFICSKVDMEPLQGVGKWLGMASYAFDVHLLELFFPWRHGMATLTAPRSMLLDNLGLAMQKFKVTHASFVPSLVDSAGLDPANLPDLRYMSVGGEKITKNVIDTWSRSHVTLANAYGPTEMTIGCCFREVEPTTNVRNIGPPLLYTVAHVLRPGTTEYALRGTSGELCLTGDLVANGYYKRPDAKGFVEDFNGKRMYRSGDKVRLMADGSLEFLGRDDDQTKIRGQRIELGEVAETVRTGVGKVLGVATVEVASIVAQHPSIARSRLVAFVAIVDGAKNGRSESSRIIDFQSADVVEQIRAHCGNALPSFMVPDHIIRITSMPLVTISRKIDNKRLKTMFADVSVTDLMSYNKPASPNSRKLSEAEETVRKVATEVLGIDQAKIRVDINLFQLGLDSLNAISLAIKLQKKGFNTTVSNILNNPSPQKIAMLPRKTADEGIKVTPMSFADLKQRFVAKSRNGYDRSDIAAVRPCLPLQETLVASSLDRKGETLYVNHVVMELSPDVDHHRLIQAWTATAEDHEILRTCFHQFEKHFVQVVLKPSLLSCNHSHPSDVDAASFNLREREPAIAKEIVENIESKPPIRITLAAAQSSGQKSMLLVSLHHALYDAESFSMILDEVYVRYERISSHRNRTSIAALLDHIESQNQAEAKAFWEAYLANYKSTLLPLSPADRGSESVNRELIMPLTQIENLAASMNGTPASLMQALFGVVIAETFKIDDIVFGTILSGRTVPVENADTILAPCITTVPQRVQIVAGSSLQNIVSHAQEGFAESIEYQHTALRDIHRWMKAEGPLFDTLFSYTRKPRLASWSHLWSEVRSSMPSEFPLAVEIVADQKLDRVILRCDFLAAFGTLDRAGSLLVRLEQLLQSLMQGDTRTLRSSKSSEFEKELPRKPVPNEWSENERLMKDIIAEVVDFVPEDITRDTSFFALGLDSIIAIQFGKNLRQHDIQCSSADVMRYPSISELTQHAMSNRQWNTDFKYPVKQPQHLHNTLQHLHDEILETYPCTPLQSSMLTQTLGSDGSLYVHHHAIRLSAGLGLPILKKTLQELVACTQILRTSFHFSQEDRSWHGIVHKKFDILWNEHDRSHNLEQILPHIKKSLIFREDSDFASPPWAVHVVKNVCIFSLHHTLYDGESLNLLFHDLSIFSKGNRPPKRPPFSQAAQAIHERIVEAEDFWIRSLEGFECIDPISVINERQEIKRVLNLDLTATFSESSKRLGVTPQSVALLAFGKTLVWLLGRRDVVFGHIVRGRAVSTLEADDVIGPLFNTVPIRVKLEGTVTTNIEVAKATQRLSGASQAHQHASLSKVQQTWRNKIGNPDAELFDTLFVFQKRSMSEENRPWTLVDVDDDTAPTEYPTNFEIEQAERDVVICMNSTRTLDLHAFLQTYEQILRNILQQPEDSATAVFDDLPLHTGKITSDTDLLKSQDQVGSGIIDASLGIVRGVLAEVSGIQVANIANDASIFSLGLDSLSAIQIAAKGRTEGLNVNVADVLQGRTVLNICQRIHQKESGQTAKAGHTEPSLAQSTTQASQIPTAMEDSKASKSNLPALAGLQENVVQDVQPCLPGQLYYLTTWLKSGRTLGEASFTYVCRKILELDRLLEAWRTLRECHPILRTVFVATSETSAAQIVLRPAAASSDAFQFIHLPSLGQDMIAQIVKQEACRRFDLFSPPLELVLVRTRDGDCVVLRMHHALYDAWTIQMIVNNLSMNYEGHGVTSDLSSSALVQHNLQSSGTKASPNYWRGSLRGAQPTILSSAFQEGCKIDHDFFFVKQVMPDLHQLEERCQQCDTSLPTVLLIAFARTLARYVSVRSPTFGLFQAGRSFDIDGVDKLCFPCLNMTPLMIRDVTARNVKSLTKDVSSDLAARVPFEQSYLHDIMKWIGRDPEPLFNTFINILWRAETEKQADGSSDELLSTCDLGNVEDIAPGDRMPGKTAVDGLDTSVLAAENLYLDVQKCAKADSVLFCVRCDRDVLGEEEAKTFIASVIDEVVKCIEGCEALWLSAS